MQAVNKTVLLGSILSGAYLAHLGLSGLGGQAAAARHSVFAE
jgi:hypothetical protein